MPSIRKVDQEEIIKVDAHPGRYSLDDWLVSIRAIRFQSILSGNFSGVANMLTNVCDDLLSNSTLIRRLKGLEGDVLIADTCNYCGQAVGEVLRIPHITLNCGPLFDPSHTSWDRDTGKRMNPGNVLSYTPQLATGLSNKMTFPGRLKNFVTYAAISLVDYYGLQRGLLLPLWKKHGIQLGTPEALRRGVLHLVNTDFALEFPRHLPPNVIFFGATLPSPAGPLPVDLQEYLESSGEQGVVYVSLGNVGSLDLQEYKELAAALSKLPSKVVWKLSPKDLPDGTHMEDIPIGDNIKVVDWVPQNDLLGSPHVRAYLCHGGLNSVSEAAYHAVPIVGVPMIADQPNNVAKAVAHGFGLALQPDKGELREPLLTAALTRVLSEPSFKEAAMVVSQRMRARPRTPPQVASDWIEHVIVTGAEPYLQTPENDMSLFVLWGLDVAAFLLFVLAAGGVTLYGVLQALYFVMRRFMPRLPAYWPTPKGKAD